MKKINNIIVLVFNFCLFFCSIFVTVLLIASSKDFYKNTFKSLGYYEQGYVVYDIGGEWDQSATFSSEQYDQICNHIVDYLFTSKESFSLTMDNVCLNGEIQNNVSIFGNDAVIHMYDVKVLLKIIVVLTISLLIVGIILLIYIVKHLKVFKPILFKMSCGFLLGVVGLFIMLFACAFFKMFLSTKYITFDNFIYYLWNILHYIFFVFNTEKVNGSAFNDTLTSILSMDFFSIIIIIVVLIVVIVFITWFIIIKKILCLKNQSK